MAMGEDRRFIEHAMCRSNGIFVIEDVLGSLRRESNDHRSQNYSQECRVQCEEALASSAHGLDGIEV